MIVNNNDDIDDLIDVLESITKHKIKNYHFDLKNNCFLFKIKKVVYKVEVDVEEIDIDSFVNINKKQVQSLIVLYFQTWIKRKQYQLMMDYKK